MNTIAWDIDDTLGDCQLSWIKWLANQGYGDFKRSDFKTYNLSETFKCPVPEAQRRLALFLESEELDAMMPFPEATRLLERFSHLNQHAITGRPVDILERTRGWVDKNFPGKIKHICATGANPMHGRHTLKAEACKIIGAKLLIEDAPLFVPDCLMSDINVILIEKPWNTSFDMKHPLLHRVEQLSQVGDIMEKILEATPRQSYTKV